VAVDVPAQLREVYADWRWSLYWDSTPDALTWRLEHADGRVRFAKLGPVGIWVSKAAECKRMRWAKPHLPVPDVVDYGSNGETEWLVTLGLPGIDATQHPLRERPPKIAAALGAALRRFHVAAPVRDCPFDSRLETALATIHARAEQGLIVPADFNDDNLHHTLESALAYIEQHLPANEDLVVCHGDYCPPNILLNTDGNPTGYLDLGELGVSDRWRDHAVGAWAVTWNYGPGHEHHFYNAYGTETDTAKVAFYRLLYDLVS
jgi:kanamycin kinase